MTGARTDTLIAGGGFAGLALAIALRQALGPAFAVTVADPLLARPAVDARASAIAAAARRLLETIGVWQTVASEAQDIVDMVITDSRLGDAVRPVFLTFGGEVEPGEPFAQMIENGPLLAALVAKAKEEGVALVDTPVIDFSTEADRIAATLGDGRTLAARLLVAADGVRSRIRELAGITMIGWDYGQSAIVATVAHARDHHGRAIENFLPAGPFAILPLKNNRASLVWVEEGAEAARIIVLPDAEFHAELEARFGLHLGELAVVGPRQAYPLGFGVARSFIGERLALVGDAAHRIHPIAGQGLNLGLRDAWDLAQALHAAEDPGAPQALARFGAARRLDAAATIGVTEVLARGFLGAHPLARAARGIALTLLDVAPPARKFFARRMIFGPSALP